MRLHRSPLQILQTSKAGDCRETHIYSRKIYERIIVRWKPDDQQVLSLKAVHSDELNSLKLNNPSPVVFRGAFTLSKKQLLPAKQAFVIIFLPRLCRGKKKLLSQQVCGLSAKPTNRARGRDVRRKSHFSDFFDGLQAPWCSAGLLVFRVDSRRKM